MVTGLALTLSARSAEADCTLANVATPLNDLAGDHKGSAGGLYPGGHNVKPDALASAALEIATNKVLPRAADGSIDMQSGSVVLLSVGMSNTTQEFAGGFMPQVGGDGSLDGQLVIVDGAQGGNDANSWADPNGQVYQTVGQRLQQAGVTPEQVQVAWMKQALAGPANDFPTHAEELQDRLEDVARNLRERYPNLRLLYMSSRTRAFTDGSGGESGLNPEPQAYESAFSVRWMIESQQSGAAELAWNEDDGAAVAPLVLWGPYLWADGDNPRSDGFVWTCDDVGDDFTHPSGSGVQKVGQELVAFFKTDPTTIPWFLSEEVSGQAPSCAPEASPAEGDPGVAVDLTANAGDPDGNIVQYAWTFDDGGFSMDENPSKTFPIAGLYEVHLTVTDDDGNATTCTVIVDVGMSGGDDGGTADGGTDDGGTGDTGADSSASVGDESGGDGGSDGTDGTGAADGGSGGDEGCGCATPSRTAWPLGILIMLGIAPARRMRRPASVR